MKLQRSWMMFLSGALAIGIAACQKKEAASATAATPAPVTVGTETTVASTTPAPPAASVPVSAPLTADPVAASRHNAERRRQHSSSAGVGSGRSEGTTTRYGEARPPAPPAREHEVPAGTILRVAFDQTISTAAARTGETYGGELLDDLLAADGAVVAPSGSHVVGRVENAVASGRLGGQAELKFRLVQLVTGGQSIPISTSAYERKGEAHTKHDAEYVAGGAAVGALLGQLIGRDTKSTLEGAAAGAAAGTGVGAATGKLDFEIQAGRTVAFTLEQPLRVRGSP